MAETFGARLAQRVGDLGPLCVGLDPSRDVLAQWGRADSVEGAEFCALALVEAASGTAVAVKPQVAFFERFGSAGFRVLERVIAEASGADLLVIADAKRGDIDSTNEGYAQAWLEEGSPLGVDALTVHPYLGVGSLAPVVAVAERTGRGVFVLAATSNPEGREVQSARTLEHERVEDLVVRRVAQWNARADGRGTIGVVLGATRERLEADLATLGGPCLVPGVGAQGATARDVGRLVARCAPDTVVANVARAISRSGPERGALRDAARRWRDELAAALP